MSDEQATDGLSPQAERELAAIDDALADRPVAAEHAELTRLAAEIREQRPEPRPEWGSELDARAAGGFGGSRLAGLRRRLEERRPRALLAPAGALATLLLLVAVAATTIEGGGTDESATGGGAAVAPQEAESGATADESAGAGGSTALFDRSQRSSRDLNGAVSGGRTAPGVDKRRVDRGAELTLATETGEVREVSDGAVQITESGGGVVRSSNLTERESGATAVLELSIPTRELDSALDQLTDLATVSSLSEGSVDITRPFVSAQDRLQDARAERSELLKALGNAADEQEAESIRKQLNQARRRISRAESAFEGVARRARNAEVSVRVEGSADGGGAAGWSLGDALDDALSALETLAGVLLVAAAVLTPFALLALLGALAARAFRNARREEALDKST